MKKGTLTEKQFNKLVADVWKYKSDDFVIPRWKYPLLWLLPVWKISRSEHWTLTYKKWGNVIYLVRSEENK